jgi:predicted NBD/HSP70 family sugar kinase
MLAVDLGGTRIKAAVDDGLVSVVTHGSATLAGALSCLEQVMARLVPDGCDVAGLCLPGLVDEDRVVALPGKLDGAVGFDLVGWLTALTGGQVFVVNDALAYGLGEAADLPGRTVVLTLGTGVGCCVVEDGAPLGRGPLGAGTLGGQLPLTADGPLDTSGRAGTIEAWCRADRVDEPGYRDRLAQGIAALCLAYGPDRVVVGGGAASAELLEGLEVEPLLWPGQRVEVRLARFGDAAALRGLAALA